MGPDLFLEGCWPKLFPPVEKALPSGLLAAGGDLTPRMLLAAYAHGIFPWYSAGDPILWWSPDPRCVLNLEDFQISRRSLRKIRNSNFICSCDQDFAQVIHACACRPEGTWLLPEMKAAYIELHRLGYAHSVEVWQHELLVGGIYGVVLGKIFFGESMFRTVNEGSRAALYTLITILTQKQFKFLDCQVSSPHMLAMGARDIPRREFLSRLAESIGAPGQKQDVWRCQPKLVAEL